MSADVILHETAARPRLAMLFYLSGAAVERVGMVAWLLAWPRCASLPRRADFWLSIISPRVGAPHSASAHSVSARKKRLEPAAPFRREAVSSSSRSDGRTLCLTSSFCLASARQPGQVHGRRAARPPAPLTREGRLA